MMQICRHGEGANCPDCYMFELEDLRKLLTHPNAQHVLKRTLREGVIRRIDLSLKKFKAAEINEIERSKTRLQEDYESAKRVPERANPPPPPYRTPSPPHSPPRSSRHVSEHVTYSPPGAYMSPYLPEEPYIVHSPHHQGRHSVPARRYSPTHHPYSPYSSHETRTSLPHPVVNHDLDDEFFSARSAIPRNRFQPSIVRGSAFGSNHGALATCFPNRPGFSRDAPSAGISVTRPLTRNMRWTDEEVAMLAEGYARCGPRWETIRGYYPNLARFTGQQLKDKYRTL